LTCPCRELHPAIPLMQAAEGGDGDNLAEPLD